MRIQSDAIFRIGERHVRLGEPCQDYALAGNNATTHFALVSDGCSSGGYTDVGSRVVVHTATGMLDIFAIPDIGSTFADCVALKANALHLKDADLFATFGGVWGAISGVHAVLYGDGAIVSLLRDGRITAQVVEWQNSMPFYPIYARSESHMVRDFTRAHGEETVDACAVTTHVRDVHGAWSIDCVHTRTALDAHRGLHTAYNHDTLGDIAAVFVMTDGVQQVQNKDKSMKPVTEVLQAFTRIQSTEGRFIARRVNRALSDWHKDGSVPIDDVSVAALYLHHNERTMV